MYLFIWFEYTYATPIYRSVINRDIKTEFVKVNISGSDIYVGMNTFMHDFIIASVKMHTF